MPAALNPVHSITLKDAAFVLDMIAGQAGDLFEFVNESENCHSSTEQSGLQLWDSGLIRGARSHNPETWGVTIPWAGTYQYRDEVGGNGGAIAVSPQITVIEKGLLHITIAAAPAPQGVSFEAAVRHGTGQWKTIDEHTLGQEFELCIPDNETIAVRACLVRKSDGASTYSPKQGKNT